MKYLQEFEDKAAVLATADRIKEVATRESYRFMEFCGGHTHSLFRYGLLHLLPKNIQMIHGPGCPVCVLPAHRIDAIIRLLEEKPQLTLCTYADLMRVPSKNRDSLMKARARGLNIKMVYSPLDVLTMAAANPGQDFIFFAMGFETTTPPTALALLQAEKENLKNFYIYNNHVLTPPACLYVLNTQDQVPIDGFVGPGHVSTVIGAKAFEEFAREYKKPVTISGFTPLDLVQSILMLVVQCNEGRYQVENQYARAVSDEGNKISKAAIEKTMELRDSFEWRGLGNISHSALKTKSEYSRFDVESCFDLVFEEIKDHRECKCGDILRGLKSPLDCKLFNKGCTPDNPQGPCMVSSEGACSAYYSYSAGGNLHE